MAGKRRPKYIERGESMYDPKVRERIDEMFENMQGQIDRQREGINRLLAALFHVRASLESIADPEGDLAAEQMRQAATDAIAIMESAEAAARPSDQAQ